MIKILIRSVLLLSIYSCKYNSKSNIQSPNSNLQDPNNNLHFKDGLDIDTIYATPSLFKQPDSVNLFFQKADDTLQSYFLKSYILSNKKEPFSVDSFKSLVNKNGYEVFPCKKFLCGYKREFNKKYRFQLRLNKEIELITEFEYWFEGESYLSPQRKHMHE